MIKSNVERPETQLPVQFPVLMIHKADLSRFDPFIVLFNSVNEGTTIAVNDDTTQQTIGNCCKRDISFFVEFKGSITLSNS